LTLRDLIADNRSELDFLVYEETRLTFDEVYRQSRALANVMCHDYAIKPGDRVAIAMRNYPEWVITFWPLHRLARWLSP
jgi:acyl-CoA synthetase (AMP-forming)/AMP-acid ligase II